MKLTFDPSPDHKNSWSNQAVNSSFSIWLPTHSGSYDLRHFNWKVVWKPNWVKVLYLTIQVPRYSAIVSTVPLPLYWQQLVYLRCHLTSLHSVKPKSFDSRILSISFYTGCPNKSDRVWNWNNSQNIWPKRSV